jgi:RNA polymerase sigma-70 factor (ECF subfamily)
MVVFLRSGNRGAVPHRTRIPEPVGEPFGIHYPSGARRAVAASSDEELVRRWRAGDEAAGRELLARDEAVLRKRARRRLPRPLRRKVSESDVVQETLAAVAGGLVGFEDRGAGSYRAWLLQILDHKLADQERRWLHTAKRDARRELSPPASGPPEDGQPRSRLPTPSEEAIRAEARERLEANLALLDPEDAAVLRWVHQESLPFEEVGRRTGRSADAARKHYGRAVQRLARAMKASSPGAAP